MEMSKFLIAQLFSFGSMLTQILLSLDFGLNKKVCLRGSSEGLFDTLCQPRLAPRNSEFKNVKQGSTLF